MTPTLKNKLNTENKNCYVFKNQNLEVFVLGGVSLRSLDQLRITLKINAFSGSKSMRNTLDLYNYERVEKYTRTLAQSLEIGISVIGETLSMLTDLLEDFRLEQLENQKKKVKAETKLTVEQQKQAISFLKSPDLLKNIDGLIGQTGIVGENKARLFLFLIALSHKMPNTLHAMVQGTTGSGKSHLIGKIADLMPQESVKRFTRVSDKSFYNYGEYDLQNHLILLEDYDGMNEDAEFAWRELQSNQQLVSSVCRKDSDDEQIKSSERIVKGPIASLVATTHLRVYEDNESRVFTIAIDEGAVQTQRVLDYMVLKAAQKISVESEKQAVALLQHLVVLLKPYKVLNKYTLSLPSGTKQIRRLSQMLQDFIAQVTLVNQYQRKKIGEDTLVCEIDDIEAAIELMFSSILLKVDELDGILRQFYENLKAYVEDKDPEYEFTQREVRQVFKVSKTQSFRYFNELLELEYIVKTGTGQRNTFKYKIGYWDNIEKIRDDIKKHLSAQIDVFKSNQKK